MDAEPVAIPDDATVERALDEFFLRYRWPWFPVTDAAQRFRRPAHPRVGRRGARAEPRRPGGVGDVFEADASRKPAGPHRRAARVAARQRRAAPPRRARGGRRRRHACAGSSRAQQVGRALRDALDAADADVGRPAAASRIAARWIEAHRAREGERAGDDAGRAGLAPTPRVPGCARSGARRSARRSSSRSPGVVLVLYVIAAHARQPEGVPGRRRGAAPRSTTTPSACARSGEPVIPYEGAAVGRARSCC